MQCFCGRFKNKLDCSLVDKILRLGRKTETGQLNTKVVDVWVFGSDAPPPFRLDSWDMTSQKIYAVKQRMGNKISERGVLPCPITYEQRAQTLSLFWCTQSNTDNSVTSHPSCLA